MKVIVPFLVGCSVGLLFFGGLLADARNCGYTWKEVFKQLDWVDIVLTIAVLGIFFHLWFWGIWYLMEAI